MDITDDSMAIGFELECSIKRSIADEMLDYIRDAGGHVVDDGSIASSVGLAKEIRSPVVTLDHLNRLHAFIHGICSGLNKSNKTMGFHVHVSFEDFRPYVMISSKEFFEFFKSRYIKSFTTDRERSRLTNHFCNAEEYSPRDRYRMINIIDAWYRHKTIEFRIFPSSSQPSKLMSYIGFTINSIKDYLKNAKPEEETIEYKRKVITTKELNILLSEDTEHGLYCPVCGRVIRE